MIKPSQTTSATPTKKTKYTNPKARPDPIDELDEKQGDPTPAPNLQAMIAAEVAKALAVTVPAPAQADPFWHDVAPPTHIPEIATFPGDVEFYRIGPNGETSTLVLQAGQPVCYEDTECLGWTERRYFVDRMRVGVSEAKFAERFWRFRVTHRFPLVILGRGEGLKPGTPVIVDGRDRGHIVQKSTFGPAPTVVSSVYAVQLVKDGTIVFRHAVQVETKED